MTDDVLDPRIVRTLQAYASGGTRPIDAVAIATSAALDARGGRFGRLAVSRWPQSARLLLYVGLLGLLLLGGLLAYAGSRQRLPQPFGPAGNGQIVFSRDGDIYVGHPGSDESHAIVLGPDTDTGPLFSLGGTRMTVLREVPGGVVLVAMNPDGSDPVVLNEQPFVDPVFGAWSPTGDTFAIASTIRGAPRLTLVNTDGSGTKVVAEDLAITSFAFRPPDGAELLVRGESDDGVGLYAIDTVSLERRTVVAPTGLDPQDWDLVGAAYSPDGTKIAFQRHDPAARVTRLHVVDADGTNGVILHQPGLTFEGSPVWSPDGTRLAIVTNDTPWEQWGVDGGWAMPFLIIPTDGTGPGVRTGPPAPSGSDITWAPDGTSLLMIRDLGGGRGSHLLLDPEGGPFTELPWDADYNLSWQRVFSP